MQLVEDHIFQVLEEPFGLLVGQQQRHLFRRGQQDVRRVELLALAFGLRRVAGAVLDRDVEAHFEDGLHQVALDIDRERLQGRDVERVDAGEGGAGRDPAAPRQIGQRRQEPGKRLAGAGGRNQQHVFARCGARQQFQLMGARLPALLREPFLERPGQKRGVTAGGMGFDDIHAVKLRETARKRRGLTPAR
jgi:hypothetical protein